MEDNVATEEAPITLEGQAFETLRRVLGQYNPTDAQVAQANVALGTLYMLRDK